MPVQDGVECVVYTADGALAEFSCVEDAPPHISSVYIQARDGQHFSIRCSVASPNIHMPRAEDTLTFHVEIDGVKERPIVLDHDKPCISIDGTRLSTPNGGWELRRFLFSSVQLTEESSSEELALEMVNKIGVINVAVCRYVKAGEYTASRPREAHSGLETSRVVIHEKTIKGKDISHSVQRAKGEYCEPVTSIAGMYMDREEQPYMAFRFLYKSERTLKNMALIERSPSPQILWSRAHTVKPEAPRLKRERSASAGPSKRARTQVNLGGIETIDLTGDD